MNSCRYLSPHCDVLVCYCPQEPRTLVEELRHWDGEYQYPSTLMNRAADELVKAEKGLKLLAIVEKFIKDHHVSCSDAIGQSDDVIINATELIYDLCEVVDNYYDWDKEDLSKS